MTTTPQDPSRPERDFVDIENEDDVEVWTRSLGISRSDLERAVELVGPSAGQVYDYLNRARQP